MDRLSASVCCMSITSFTYASSQVLEHCVDILKNEREEAEVFTWCDGLWVTRWSGICSQQLLRKTPPALQFIPPCKDTVLTRWFFDMTCFTSSNNLSKFKGLVKIATAPALRALALRLSSALPEIIMTGTEGVSCLKGKCFQELNAIHHGHLIVSQDEIEVVVLNLIKSGKSLSNLHAVISA